MGLLSLFSKESKSTTQNTSNTSYTDTSANAGGAGSIAAGQGANVSVQVNDLSEKVALGSLGAQESVSKSALGATEAVSKSALGATEAVSKSALNEMSGTTKDALGSNQAVSYAAIGSNEAVTKAAMTETGATARYAMDANTASLGFLTNTVIGLSERAAKESADVRASNDLALQGARSLISTLQSQTGSALERAQAPEAASVKAILTPILWVVGVVLVAAFIFAGKSKTKDKQ